MPEALIWGATGGIGSALIDDLSAAGWRIYAASRSIDDIPDAVFERYAFEAADENSIRDIAVDIAQQTDGLDLWVYAAGEMGAERLSKMSVDTWSAVLNSNLNGAFSTISRTVHLMKEGGQAVFIGAYVDHLILPKMGAYAAAKAGLEPLVEIVQKENRKINFTLVKPGAVDTRFWENAPFKMPAGAKPAQMVARAIVTQFENGQRGILAL